MLYRQYLDSQEKTIKSHWIYGMISARMLLFVYKEGEITRFQKGKNGLC